MTEQRVRRSVPADHPCFAGHFPGNPVVPGVLLLDMVAEAVLENVQANSQEPPTSVTGIPAVKFLRPLQPQQIVEIVWHETPGGIIFHCETDEGLVAQGRLQLGTR